MRLVEKIMQLRKQRGLSQEELADEVGVSRQAVSKWESGQTVPDLEKVVKLAEFFAVSTDYLLKDEEEETATVVIERADGGETPVKEISQEEAEAYLQSRKNASWKIALGACLCVLSPITMFLLLAFSLLPTTGISETVASVTGICVLLVIVAVAVGFFVWSGLQNAPYEYLEKEKFRLTKEAQSAVKTVQKQMRPSYIAYTIVAVCLCVLSPVSMLIGSLSENEFLVLTMLGVLLAVVSIAVFLFTFANVRMQATQRLLKEGEYNPKKGGKIQELISSVYWLLATVVYFVWSFGWSAWAISWIVWPIAGVLFGIVEMVLRFVCEEKDE